MSDQITGIGLGAIIIMAFIYFMFIRDDNYKYLLKNGIITKAKILDVEKTSTYINQRRQIRIVYEIKYSDITDEVVREDSLDSDVPFPKINDIVDVAVDPKNGNNLIILSADDLKRIKEKYPRG